MSSSKITKDDLDHIAKLARIQLTDQEKDTYLPQLESVLEYLEILNKANTDGVEPTFRVNQQQNVFHQDEVCCSFDQQEALSTATKKSDGYFEVIGTIKK